MEAGCKKESEVKGEENGRARKTELVDQEDDEWQTKMEQEQLQATNKLAKKMQVHKIRK
jgi:hypothetical protein